MEVVMTWTPTRFAPRTDPARRQKDYDYVRTEEAAATGRCICEGCRFCRGEQGFPCGVGIGENGAKCSWCRRVK